MSEPTSTHPTFASGLIVDDHPDALAWLSAATTNAFADIEILEAYDLRSALTLITNTPPDLAIIDLGLPDGSGVELIEYLNREHPQTYKIVATVFGDDKHLFDALRAGAQGYVLKDETPTEMSKMLTGIAAGQPPLSASIARRLLNHFNVHADAPKVKLTDREKEVLTLLAKGYTVKRVAELLHITRNTAAGYVKDIYRKLNVSNRAEATLAASRQGLVSPDSM